MKRWLLLPTVWFAGCAKPTAPVTFDPIMALTEDSGRTVVTSTGRAAYRLEFGSTADGIAMPLHLDYEGGELLAGGDLCPGEESGVGIHIHPIICAVAALFDGATTTATQTVRSTIVPGLRGPVIASAKVHWEVEYECSIAHTASGDSTFTMFPNGRILRHDENVRASQVEVVPPPSTVQCGGFDTVTAFYLTSFWSFSALREANLDALDRPTNTSDGALIDNPPAACAVWPTRKVGVRWTNPTPMTRLAPNAGVNAFVYDWLRDSPSLPPTPRDMVMALQLSTAATCAEVLAELEPHSLVIDGVLVDEGADGIYFDAIVHDDAFEVSTPLNHAGGFAISVNVGAVDHLIVTRNGEDPGHYIVQRDGDRLIVWFEEPLDMDENLQIEPR